MIIECIIETPQFSNRKVVMLKQKGKINTNNWVFEPSELKGHKVFFHTKESFIKALITQIGGPDL
jgi:hypothetical protein